jgi:hypothetical protein
VPQGDRSRGRVSHEAIHLSAKRMSSRPNPGQDVDFSESAHEPRTSQPTSWPQRMLLRDQDRLPVPGRRLDSRRPRRSSGRRILRDDPVIGAVQWVARLPASVPRPCGTPATLPRPARPQTTQQEHLNIGLAISSEPELIEATCARRQGVGRRCRQSSQARSRTFDTVRSGRVERKGEHRAR